MLAPRAQLNRSHVYTKNASCNSAPDIIPVRRALDTQPSLVEDVRKSWSLDVRTRASARGSHDSCRDPSPQVDYSFRVSRGVTLVDLHSTYPGIPLCEVYSFLQHSS